MNFEPSPLFNIIFAASPILFYMLLFVLYKLEGILRARARRLKEEKRLKDSIKSSIDV